MELKIDFENEQEKIPVSEEMGSLLARAIRETLEMEAFDANAEVSLTLTDNDAIRELNREYRDKDAATDVLSFPMYDEEIEVDPTGWATLGDIVISMERAKAQAEEFGHSLEREICFLAAHSTLHLLGYDHELSEEDDREMRAKQNEVMRRMGLSLDNQG